MNTLRSTKMEAHRKNIDRYCGLLNTDLTEAERRFLHKRIAQERGELERLEILQRKSEGFADAKTVIAAQCIAKRRSGQSHA